MTVLERLRWAALFLLPGVSLVVPSGYSYGALLLVVIGCVTWLRNPRALTQHSALQAWAFVLFCTSLVWSSEVWRTGVLVTKELEQPLKVLLVIGALPAVVSLGKHHLQTLAWGCCVGSFGAAGLALWQLHIELSARPSGYTNAIAFSSIAVMLGVWCVVLVSHLPRPLRWMGSAAAVAALCAIVVAQTRNTWLAAPILFGMAYWYGLQTKTLRALPWVGKGQRMLALVMLASVAFVAYVFQTKLEQGFARARDDIVAYHNTRQADSSVGARLAMWKLAVELGAERPVFGWGNAGYHNEKKARAAAGVIPQSIVQFGHAHNEWLEAWTKRGLVGVGVLLMLFFVPMWWFAATLRAAHPHSVGYRAAVAGLVTVVGYLIFGLTQVSFAHNSTTLVYLFMVSVWLGFCTPSAHKRAP